MECGKKRDIGRNTKNGIFKRIYGMFQDRNVNLGVVDPSESKFEIRLRILKLFHANEEKIQLRKYSHAQISMQSIPIFPVDFHQAISAVSKCSNRFTFKRLVVHLFCLICFASPFSLVLWYWCGVKFSAKIKHVPSEIYDYNNFTIWKRANGNTKRIRNKQTKNEK